MILYVEKERICLTKNHAIDEITSTSEHPFLTSTSLSHCVLSRRGEDHHTSRDIHCFLSVDEYISSSVLMKPKRLFEENKFFP